MLLSNKSMVIAGRSFSSRLVLGTGKFSSPEAMRDAIPGASLVVVPGAGHLPNLEQPALFNAALNRFLDLCGSM